MEILTMEKEREKRFKNNLKKETRKYMKEIEIKVFQMVIKNN